MANFPIEVEILVKPAGFFKTGRLALIEALAHGFSNNAIAEELDISIKSVERILNEINTKLGNKAGKEYKDLSKIFNPRLRLLTSLIATDICEIHTNTSMRYIENLTESLEQTLILCCVGFSNKTIAELFEVSEKAIELRFTHLFDYFGVDTKSLRIENPRVNLFISAYCRNNIKKAQVSRLYRETHFNRLDEILMKPAAFLDRLDGDYKIIG
ncbi:MAG: LuxR C-terminal-related transcriptional regulator [Cyanobacteria bacterium]|nr:LuxR C-terminal-related transcriptional regulator [Cyanobacteriota bacterium]MDA1020120.1 LuxR C-terminal-related transcriptional regulator [Cyanobacteriota bacterium]